METTTSPRGMTPRQLMSRATAAGAAFVVGAGFMAALDAAWAVEMKALSPETFATLTQMARDIDPHDRVGDAYDAAAVRMDDTNEGAEGVEAGIAARDAGFDSYLATLWEADQVAILRGMENLPPGS